MKQDNVMVPNVKNIAENPKYAFIITNKLTAVPQLNQLVTCVYCNSTLVPTVGR